MDAMTTQVSSALQGRAGLRRDVVRFAGVGVLSTVLHLGLFALLARAGLAVQIANGLSLVVATVANTAANRSWTFGVRGRDRLATHHGQALLVFAITWLATSAALWVLGRLAPTAGTGAQTLVVAVANAASTVLRFVAMRAWIFRGDRA